MGGGGLMMEVDSGSVRVYRAPVTDVLLVAVEILNGVAVWGDSIWY